MALFYILLLNKPTAYLLEKSQYLNLLIRSKIGLNQHFNYFIELPIRRVALKARGERSLIQRMKALSTLKSAINHSSIFGIIALVLLAPVTFPHLALAAELQTSSQALVFEIKDFSKIETQSLLTIQQISAEDPLVKNLKTYLKKYGSPLDVYAADIIMLPRWDDALAISFVESNMGKFCFNNNCSGIGVKPGHPSWRKYPDKLAWFKDLSALLQKPIYSEKYTTFRKMKGVYVQPGSENWVRGAEKIKSELSDIQEKSVQERIALMDHYELALAK